MHKDMTTDLLSVELSPLNGILMTIEMLQIDISIIVIISIIQILV